jgi:hypothetical protein
MIWSSWMVPVSLVRTTVALAAMTPLFQEGPQVMRSRLRVLCRVVSVLVSFGSQRVRGIGCIPFLAAATRVRGQPVMQIVGSEMPRSRAAVTAGLLLNGGVQTILLSLTLAVSCVPTGLSSIVSLIRLSMRMVIAMPCTQHVQRAVVFAKTG